MSELSTAAPPNTTPGGVDAALAAPAAPRFLVAPTTTTKANVLRPALRPAACWRIESHRFDVGSSFILPNGAVEFATLAKRRPPCNDDARANALKLAVFGHADATGTTDANKALSGRRALAIYGLLTRDLDLWNRLYEPSVGSDAWGLRAVQWMLAALGHPPGGISGRADEQTTRALRRYQAAAGIGASGKADAPTRHRLFAEYMDAICVDERNEPFKYVPEDFLGAPGDPSRKASCQGCSEHNPLVVPSKKQAGDLAKPERKALRDEEYRNNRRVVVYMFSPTMAIDPSRWPCPTTDEGAARCEAMFWRNGAERREPGDAHREHMRQELTFSCRFYDSLTRFSPCERTRRTVSVWLHDARGKRLPRAPFRFSSSGEETIGSADAQGKARIEGVFTEQHATLEWGATQGAGDATSYGYRATIHLDFDDTSAKGADETIEEARRRLSNLGYRRDNFYVDLAAFQRDHGLDEKEWPDESTKRALWSAHSGGDERTSHPPSEGEVPKPAIEPLHQDHSR